MYTFAIISISSVVSQQMWQMPQCKNCTCHVVWLVILQKWALGYPLKISVKRTRGLLNKEQFLFGIAVFQVFCMTLCSLVSGEAFLSPLGSLFAFSHLLLYSVLSSYCASSFFFFIFTLCIFLCVFPVMVWGSSPVLL
jgi:hypothetical protein